MQSADKDLKFRTDINGIRALAVLSVVLFHFYPQWFKGGFAGVDMFYVISGYLMTSIIVRRMEAGRFRLRDFYLARAQRIVPALAVMCLVVLLYACLNTNRALRYEIAGDVAASLAFFSNFVYWREAGYFDTASVHKWLLHSWSLSLEWQFYLSYPLILMLLSRICSGRSLRIVLAGLLLSSFGFSLWASVRYPDAAFYLLPTRLWEMLAGAMVVVYPVTITRPQVKHALFLIGLALLLSGTALIGSELAWPGIAALAPVLGVVAIIVASCKHSALDLPAVQALGKWSYSIYLWHWPVVVLIYYQPEIALLPWKLDLLAWSIILGFASYQLVEKRSKPLITLAVYLAALLWAIFTQAVSVVSLPSLIDYRTYDQHYCKDINEAWEQTCRVYGDSKQLDFILWGDSHAINLTRFLGETQRYNFVSFAVPGCPPFDAVRRRDEGGGAVACNRGINDKVFEKIASSDASTLLLTARWSIYLSGQIINGEDTHRLCPANSNCTELGMTPRQSFIELFQSTLSSLPENMQIVILRGNPILQRPGKYFLVGIGDTLSLQQHRSFQAEVDSIIDQLQQPNSIVLDAAPLLFDEDSNLVVHQGNRYYYLDDNHLTYYGWKRIERDFIPLLENALQTNSSPQP